jgi:hypothetical protein
MIPATSPSPAIANHRLPGYRWAVNHRFRPLLPALIGTLLLPANLLAAADWPQFLGPDRNLTTTSAKLNLTPPGGEPPTLWSRESGSGWSGPVVAGERLILHHRIQDEEVVTCLDATTGEPVWEYRAPTQYRDSMSSNHGPRATPAIAGGSVFTFGADGKLTCLELATGRFRWSVDTRKEFQADTGFFGMDCSPLIEQGLVLMQIGGRDRHGLVAFEAETGKVRWHATGHEAGYSSPVAATIGGQRQALFFTREGLVATDPLTGRVMFEHRWRSTQHSSVNAASPVVIGNAVLLTASYDTGAVLLRVIGAGVRPLWQGNDMLSAHYATPVHHHGLLFGFHGRVDFPTGAELRGLDAETGKVLWTLDPIRSGTLLLVNDTLFVLSEDGELFIGPASSKGFKPALRSQILGRETRANSAFANGIYYARGKDRLVALDFRKSGSPSPK